MGKTKLKLHDFWCVVCGKKVISKADDMGIAMIKNKRVKGGKIPALKSVCSKCETNLTKFIPRDKDVVAQRTKQFGKW